MQASRCRTGIVLALCFWGALRASACDIPVYRYALDNWQPDPYELIVFHRGLLDGETQRILNEIPTGAKANLKVTRVDVETELDGPTRALWEAQSPQSLPWLVLCYPKPVGAQRQSSNENPLGMAIWSGACTEERVTALTHSPARAQVMRGILDGHAAVWVQLDGGDAAADEAAERTIRTHIEGMPAALREMTSGLAAEFPIKGRDFAFSYVRLSRDNPAEAPFVQMLLHSEPDLVTYDAPMAFPIYGRGRALYALVGPGITEENIRETCEFLVSECSCLVKEGNPGTDVLMAVDWQSELAEARIGETLVPALPGKAALQLAEAHQAAIEDVPGAWFVQSIAIGLAVALVFVVAATIVLSVRQRRSS